MSWRSLAVLAFVITLAACGGSRDARVQSALDDTETDSPLATLFGVELDREYGAAEAEAATAECMARAGFDYVPAPAVAGGPGSSPLVRPSADEIETRGYGVAADLRLGIDEARGVADADPNDAIRAGLSEEELAAYDQALTGISPDEIQLADDGTPLDPVSGEPVSPSQYEAAVADGCAYQAYEPMLDPAVAQLLGSQVYAEAQNLLQADPELIGLLDDWQRCMAEGGFGYRNQGEIFDELAADGDAIYRDALAPEVDDAALDERIDALRSRELEIAAVDFRCSEDLFEAVPAITRRVEGEYIADNEDRLVDLLEAQE